MPRVMIDYARCGGMGNCIDICPNDVWEWGRVKLERPGGKRQKVRMPVPKNQDRCVACMSCVYDCPVRAITVED